MSGMRRSDRQTSSEDNARSYPRSKSKEPTSAQELKALLNTARSQRDDAQAALGGVKEEVKTAQLAVAEWRSRAEDNHQLYLREQQNHQKTLVLYHEAQAQLKYERRSKAGIKGWETRRKQENERLRQEIAEMTGLLQETLAHKDEAINNLYQLAERMDRIQQLVDSAEDSTAHNSIGMLQKFRRIWLSIREILAE